jgi:hypothetical protein
MTDSKLESLYSNNIVYLSISFQIKSPSLVEKALIFFVVRQVVWPAEFLLILV